MSAPKIPATDSIEELAQFWETHEFTDFEDQLEEVPEPLFERRLALKIRLRPEEMEEVQRVAKARAESPEELIRGWILERLQSP